MDVVISTSALNSYGSRVMTDGIDYSQYEKNPIVLWMHNRNFYGDKNSILPIGKMSDIRKVGDSLIGSIEFDDNDDFAQKIKAKYDKGVLNMVSAGIDVLTLSESPDDLLPGQTRMTIKECKLREVSCVDIGANDDSLKLYVNNEIVKMTKELNGIIPLLDKKENINLKEENNMDKVLEALNLSKGTTEDDVVKCIKEIQLKAHKSDELETMFQKQKDSRIKEMVETAIKEKKIQPDKRELFTKMGETSGIEVLSDCFKAMTSVPDVAKELKDKDKTTIELTVETWDKLDKENKLYDLKMKDAETYEKLFNMKFKK